MKIKLALLENDLIYLKRIVDVFNTKYADKLEIYSFTDMSVAISALEQNKIDVFLADEAFEIDRSFIPERCAFAYLVDSSDIESVRNESAICKFQKADLIYKRILSVFSENAAEITGLHADGNTNGRVIAFVSPSGGTGCSTAAAACAVKAAQKGKKVIYLNLEKFGSADVFFSADGTGDMSEIIYAIKSKKANISLKFESTVKQDISGVYFFSAPKNALDIAELDTDEIKTLIADLKMFGGYDYIIADFDFSIDKDMLSVLNESDQLVFVSDGSANSNVKLERAIESLNIIEQQDGVKLLLRSFLLFNRVSSHTSSKPVTGLRELGGIKRYEGFDARQLLGEISKLNVFDALV